MLLIPSGIFIGKSNAFRDIVSHITSLYSPDDFSYGLYPPILFEYRSYDDVDDYWRKFDCL